MPKAKRMNSYFYRNVRKEVNSILQRLNDYNTDAYGLSSNNVEFVEHINIDVDNAQYVSNKYIDEDQYNFSDSISDESNISQLYNITRASQ